MARTLMAVSNSFLGPVAADIIIFSIIWDDNLDNFVLLMICCVYSLESPR